MLAERQVFHAKYGRGDELVALLKEYISKFGPKIGLTSGRLYTDATGTQFTVVVESEHKDWAAYAAVDKKQQAQYRTKAFQQWFERMAPLVERGETQVFNVETVRAK